MPNPIVTINAPVFKGTLGDFTGTADFQGATGNLAYHLDPQPPGPSFGPFAMSSVTGNNFEKLGFVVGPGQWKIRVVATPTSGDGVPVSVSSATFSMNRATLRAVMPLVGGAATTSPISAAAKLDPTARAAISAAIAAAGAGVKRAAGANALIAIMSTKQSLRIFRDNVMVIRADYSGAMTLTNDGNGVRLHTSTLAAASVLANADLDTGRWRFVFGGGANNTTELRGTVGPVGSGKDMILLADTLIGDGFSSLFTFTMPAAIDP